MKELSFLAILSNKLCTRFESVTRKTKNMPQKFPQKSVKVDLQKWQVGSCHRNFLLEIQWDRKGQNSLKRDLKKASKDQRMVQLLRIKDKEGMKRWRCLKMAIKSSFFDIIFRVQVWIVELLIKILLLNLWEKTTGTVLLLWLRFLDLQNSPKTFRKGKNRPRASAGRKVRT